MKLKLKLPLNPVNNSKIKYVIENTYLINADSTFERIPTKTNSLMYLVQWPEPLQRRHRLRSISPLLGENKQSETAGTKLKFRNKKNRVYESEERPEGEG